MKILVTGAAGFIGSAVAECLAGRGDGVVGVDNINSYYDVRLKYARLRRGGFVCDATVGIEPGGVLVSERFPDYSFIRLDIADKAAVDRLFADGHFDTVVNLAAQAGVRQSITDP